MTNYNYYNNLTNRFKKNSSIEQKDKTHKPAFDKSVYDGYNGVGNALRGVPPHSQNDRASYKPTYGNAQNQWGKTVGANHDSPVYSDAVYGGTTRKTYPLIRQPLADTFSTREKATQNYDLELPDILSNDYKKKAQNQWYNKIAYGSFKDDDWFNSMVKNQEKAENWYKTTYGKKEGKKEYNALHNRLVTTPFDKIKEEEQQFVNYKASDFKVPELQPVKYSYNSNGSKGELSREKTGCYKKGDENLPFLTNYIINGNDGKTGGLNKVWQNASSAEERARIEKVAEMLRAEETDYDIGKSCSAIILLDKGGAYGLGHTAVIIKNSDGQGVYFSFAGQRGMPIDNGEMSFDILNQEQMELFFKTGDMKYIGTSSGNIGAQHYTNYQEIDITPEQGLSMIRAGVQFFQYPGVYNIATKQCDIVTDTILSAGNINYESIIIPRLSFDFMAPKSITHTIK